FAVACSNATTSSAATEAISAERPCGSSSPVSMRWRRMNGAAANDSAPARSNAMIATSRGPASSKNRTLRRAVSLPVSRPSSHAVARGTGGTRDPPTPPARSDRPACSDSPDWERSTDSVTGTTTPVLGPSDDRGTVARGCDSFLLLSDGREGAQHKRQVTAVNHGELPGGSGECDVEVGQAAGLRGEQRGGLDEQHGVELEALAVGDGQ